MSSPQSTPTREEWTANGLAALDHLDTLFYNSDGTREPGGMTVGDYRAATAAIRAALIATEPQHDLIEVALMAFDPEHPRYRDNLATKTAGTIALRRLRDQSGDAWPKCEVCGKRADAEPGRCMEHLRRSPHAYDHDGTHRHHHHDQTGEAVWWENCDLFGGDFRAHRHD